MKLRLLSLTLAVSAMALTSCKDQAAATPESTDTATTSAAAPAKLQTASFTVEGMSCAIGCANQIEKRLAKHDGVNNAKVDFEEKTATVTFDANQVDTAELINVIQQTADGNTYKATLNPTQVGGTSYVNQNEPKKDKKKKAKKATSTTTPTTDEPKNGCHGGDSVTKTSGCCSAKKA